MDTKTLIAEAKARFSHNSAKDYLREKYSNKLTVAVQNGLWKADAETINILNTFKTKKIVLMDTFGNPVEVNRAELLDTLKELYSTVMQEWYKEAKELEAKR
jgi:hypothetical protein